MSKTFPILFSLLLAVTFCFGLTPQEKKIVLQAKTELKKAQDEYSQAKSETAQARAEADASALHAQETDDKIEPLSKQIDASHANEQALGNKVKKYEPFWVQGHKFWGIGAIIAGFGILATHILILAGFLILLALIFWGLSFAFPALGPIVGIGTGFLGKIWTRITKLFAKKNNP